MKRLNLFVGMHGHMHIICKHEYIFIQLASIPVDQAYELRLEKLSERD